VKPENWEELSTEAKQAQAMSLLNSHRGILVIGQALAIASEKLMKKEPSNAQDMQIIGEVLFQPFYGMNTKEGRAQQRKAMKIAMRELKRQNEKTAKKNGGADEAAE
jgi:hypothetical protein